MSTTSGTSSIAEPPFLGQYIDGRWCAGTAGTRLVDFNPYDGSVVADLALASLDDLDRITHVNDIPIGDSPFNMFGGEKNSGIGRFNGDWIVAELTRDHYHRAGRATARSILMRAILMCGGCLIFECQGEDEPVALGRDM